MATENPFFNSDVIEVTEFPDIAQRYRVYGVPKIIVNETTSIEGALPESDFLKRVLEASASVSRA
jgi:predicted DsbA family dithiol-disulfide isomerase